MFKGDTSFVQIHIFKSTDDKKELIFPNCSQPLYFPTHAKEKASEASAKKEWVGAGTPAKRA